MTEQCRKTMILNIRHISEISAAACFVRCEHSNHTWCTEFMENLCFVCWFWFEDF